jgi:uncharacterized protein
MDREEIIAKLREYEPELKAAGVKHLFLHGSYARGAAGRDVSDVDVIAEFDSGLSLVDMVAIENRLAALLGVRVDLAVMKDAIRDYPQLRITLHFVTYSASNISVSEHPQLF